ncbi:MAG: hypothetical protein OEM99_06765 [Gammaproteobacteria bacterium]|nr:hypothetical protein [Gammaproteobacteria bacterium]
MTAVLRNAMLVVTAMSTFTSATAEATEPQVELLRNPFARPAITELFAAAASVNDVLTRGDNTELRAVLVAGPKSIVDFGGVILQIGESSNGYRLLDVGEGTATFNRKGEKVVFSLYEPDQGKSDE